MLVFVENLAVQVIFRKVFADEVQKLSADVCLYVHTVRWIKPNNAQSHGINSDVNFHINSLCE